MDVAELERNILAKLSPTLQGELCYQVKWDSNMKPN